MQETYRKAGIKEVARVIRRLMKQKGHILTPPEAAELANATVDFADAYCGRGAAYAGKGDFEKAIADCTEAIRLDPAFAEAYFNRGLAYAAKHDFNKAIPDMKRAKELDPSLGN